MSRWSPHYGLCDSESTSRLIAASLTLALLPGITKLKLQAQNGVDPISGILEKAIGRSLPVTQDRKECSLNPIFWLAPNEWLMVSQGHNSTLPLEYYQRLIDHQCFVTDVSDSLTVLEVTGSNAALLLSRGCGINWDKDLFLPGNYVNTRLFSLTVLIHMVSDTPVFRIYVDRSEAEHLWLHLKSHLETLS